MTRKALAVVVLSAVLLAGCWDYHRIDTNAFAMGMGIDLVGGNMRVTLQFPLPGSTRDSAGGGGSSGGGPGGGGQGESQFFLVQGTGRTLPEAMAEIQRRLSRPISFGHTEVLLLSEEAARNHEVGLMEQLYRFPELDKLCYVFVVRGGTAADALRVVPPQERLPALYLTTAMESLRTTRTVARPTTLLESFVVQEETGRDLLVSVVTAERGELTLDRLAVFYDDTLAEVLSPDESLALLAALGQARNISLSLPAPQGGLWAFRRLNSGRVHLSLAPGKGADQLAVAITLTGEAAGRVADGPPAAAGDLVPMEQSLANYMEAQIEATIRKLQGIGVDPLGFYARYMPELSEAQSRARYRRAKVAVTVTTSLLRKGVLH